MLEMIIACSVLGIVAGVLAGMLGIGGGVVIVPALVIILTVPFGLAAAVFALKLTGSTLNDGFLSS